MLQARDLAFSHPAGPGGQAFQLRVAELDIQSGEVLALCGASGSGKSTLLAILAGLLAPQSGSVRFSTTEGEFDLYGQSAREWRRLRRHFGFVSQDPRESLNNRRVVTDIVADPLVIHGLPGLVEAASMSPALRIAERLGSLVGLSSPRSRRERRALALSVLRQVGIGADQARRSPTNLSGGQRQRVSLARAFVLRPSLIFLDEPTSALDVSVQASIIELLRTMRSEFAETAYVLVTHDLPLARQLADRVAILDQGRIVEEGRVDRVFGEPASPITRLLLGIARADLEAIGV